MAERKLVRPQRLHRDANCFPGWSMCVVVRSSLAESHQNRAKLLLSLAAEPGPPSGGHDYGGRQRRQQELASESHIIAGIGSRTDGRFSPASATGEEVELPLALVPDTVPGRPDSNSESTESANRKHTAHGESTDATCFKGVENVPVNRTAVAAMRGQGKPTREARPNRRRRDFGPGAVAVPGGAKTSG